MGNLGKATSFVDPEGDGDVMPKLVDMLTKVKELMFFYASSMYKASMIFSCYSTTDIHDLGWGRGA